MGFKSELYTEILYNYVKIMMMGGECDEFSEGVQRPIKTSGRGKMGREK